MKLSSIPNTLGGFVYSPLRNKKPTAGSLTRPHF